MGGLCPQWRLHPLCFNSPLGSLYWRLWLAACYEGADLRQSREQSNNQHVPRPRAAAGTDRRVTEGKNHSTVRKVEARHMIVFSEGINKWAVGDDWKDWRLHRNQEYWVCRWTFNCKDLRIPITGILWSCSIFLLFLLDPFQNHEEQHKLSVFSTSGLFFYTNDTEVFPACCTQMD